jgi:hypothetical protein
MNKTIAQQLNITKFPFNIKDDKGKEIYYEDSEGYWRKSQFDDKGNKVYYETSTGYWGKIQYDDKGNEVYYEDSTGYWGKSQYGEKGNRVYFENSNGNIVDNRPKQTVEITLDEIAKKFNIDISQVRIKD